REETTEEVATLTKDISKERKRLIQGTTTLGKDQAFDLLRDEGALTLLIPRISKEIGWVKDLVPASFLTGLSNEQREAQKKLVKVSAKTKHIDGGIFIKSEIETRVKQIENQLQRIKTKAK